MSTPNTSSQLATSRLNGPPGTLAILCVLVLVGGLAVSDMPSLADDESPHQILVSVARALFIAGFLVALVWLWSRDRRILVGVTDAMEELRSGAVTGVPVWAVTGKPAPLPRQVQGRPGAGGNRWMVPIDVALAQGQTRALLFGPYADMEHGLRIPVLVHPQWPEAAIRTNDRLPENQPQPQPFVSGLVRLGGARFVGALVGCALGGYGIGLLLALQL